MALKIINAAFISKSYAPESSSGIRQGMVVAFEAATDGTAEVARANRDGSHSQYAIAGLAIDNTTTTGNTMPITSPVTLNIEARPARKIMDFQDDTISNSTNFTDPGTAKRGISVASVGGDYGSDQYSSTSIYSSGTADANGTPTYTVNATWTYGAGATNKGLLVSDSATAATVMASITEGVKDGFLWFRWKGN